MDSPRPTPSRNVWLIIALSLAAAPLFYGFVGSILLAGDRPASPAGTGALRALLRAMAVLAPLASLAVTHFALRSPLRAALEPPHTEPLLAPAVFQQRSVIALALAELTCIAGYLQIQMFGATLAEYAPYGLITLLVIVADIVPVGLGYWRAIEQRGDDGGSTTAGG